MMSASAQASPDASEGRWGICPMLATRWQSIIVVMTTSTEPSESFQIPVAAAEAYEAEFVPAFAKWAPAAARPLASPPAAGCSTSPAGPGSSPVPRLIPLDEPERWFL